MEWTGTRVLVGWEVGGELVLSLKTGDVEEPVSDGDPEEKS